MIHFLRECQIISYQLSLVLLLTSYISDLIINSQTYESFSAIEIVIHRTIDSRELTFKSFAYQKIWKISLNL